MATMLMWTFVFYILQPSPESSLNTSQQQQHQRRNEGGDYEMARTTTEEAAMEENLEKGGPSMYPQVKTSLPQVHVNLG
jgi:hypothetical protein